MVRQVEVEKTRRSNMSNSSVNAPAKKGGAGGSYTWGSATDIVDYQLLGIGCESIRVTTADIPRTAPIAEAASFDVCLDDNDAFPSLSGLAVVEKVCAHESNASEEVSPDWVFVTPEADTLDDKVVSVDSRKKSSGKKPTCESGTERSMSSDWSQAGIPHEVKIQLLKEACTSLNHEGPYGKQHASTLPLDMFRAQNAAHNQRASSLSRQKSVPRSRSKPKMIKQPNGRR
jgi:hypothetical protein